MMGEMTNIMPTHISAGRVLTQPGHKPALAASTVALADGRITAVGPTADADDGLLLMPALIDAHDHGRGQRTFAIGVPDQPLEPWLSLLAQEPRVDPYLRAAVAFARNARGGVAAVNHCHNPQRVTALVDEARGVARAAHDVGIRVAFAVPLRDRNHIAYGDPAPIAAALDKSFNDLTESIVEVPKPSNCPGSMPLPRSSTRCLPSSTGRLRRNGAAMRSWQRLPKPRHGGAGAFTCIFSRRSASANGLMHTIPAVSSAGSMRSGSSQSGLQLRTGCGCGPTNASSWRYAA